MNQKNHSRSWRYIRFYCQSHIEKLFFVAISNDWCDTLNHTSYQIKVTFQNLWLQLSKSWADDLKLSKYTIHTFRMELYHFISQKPWTTQVNGNKYPCRAFNLSVDRIELCGHCPVKCNNGNMAEGKPLVLFFRTSPPALNRVMAQLNTNQRPWHNRQVWYDQIFHVCAWHKAGTQRDRRYEERER